MNAQDSVLTTLYKKERSELVDLIKDIERQIRIIDRGWIKQFGTYVSGHSLTYPKTWEKLFRTPIDSLYKNVQLLSFMQGTVDGKLLDKHDDYRELLKTARKTLKGDIWGGHESGPRLFKDKELEIKWERLKRKLLNSYIIQPEEVVVSINESELEPVYTPKAEPQTQVQPQEETETKKVIVTEEVATEPVQTIPPAKEKPQYVLSTNTNLRALDEVLEEYDLHVAHIDDRRYEEIYNIQSRLHNSLEKSGIKALADGGKILQSNMARVKDLELLGKQEKVSEEQKLLLRNNWENTKTWYSEHKNELFTLMLSQIT